MTSFSPEPAKGLLETAGGDQFEALSVLATLAGLSHGELLGLKWDGADLSKAASSR